MTKVEELRKGIIQRLNNPEGLQEEEVDALIVAAHVEEHERLVGKAKELRFSDGVNSWTGMLTTELPAFPKPKKEKFYLNTDHIGIIPTKETKQGKSV